MYYAVQLEGLIPSDGERREEELPTSTAELLKYPGCARSEELEVTANSYEVIPLLHSVHDRLASAHVHSFCDVCFL